MTSLSQRREVIALVAGATQAGACQERACWAIGLSERTLQRWQRNQCRADLRPARVQVPQNRLSEPERQAVLAVANSDEFGHLAPSQIVPRLADRGEYVASESTFYRVLRAERQLQHRSAQRPSQPRSKPRALCASAPNQLFSWDITYLPTLVTGQYFYLYLFLDIFSRKIVGWQVYENESSALASEVMRDICLREGIAPGQVVLHSDNGSPMKGAAMLARRAQVYEAAKAANPQRWSGATRNWQPVREVHLNPDQSVDQKNGKKEEQNQISKVA
jgi:transposase InsO family protein